MQNVTDNEYIFITYYDVIKSLKFPIIKLLMSDEYRPYYKEYADFSKFENKNDEEILMTIQASPEINVLKYIATKEFDFDATFLSLIEDNPDIVKNTPLLEFGKNIHLLLKQNFVKKIYIHTDEYSKCIHEDIKSTFHNGKIVYCTGPFEEVIADIQDRITSFILNDADLIYKLIKLNKINKASVMLPEYAYNYKLDDKKNLILKIDNIEKLAESNVFKIAMFFNET